MDAPITGKAPLHGPQRLQCEVWLQFPLAHPAVTELVLGSRHQEEWDDSLAMLAHPIPTSFWADLRRERLLPEQAPVPEARP